MDIKEIIGSKIFSVSEFNDFVNGILSPLEACVEGEVAEWRVSQGKFIWFTLKDGDQTLPCFAMAFRVRVPVEIGMRVRIWGRARIFGKSGKYSFNVDNLEPAGAGSLERAYLLLKAKLESEGVFDAARKRALPAFPETIGLVTSETGAAVGDFMTALNKRFGGVRVLLAPVTVQGKSAADEISAALAYLGELRPDAIVLTRGGGGAEDLAPFNDERVVRAVFGCPAPVVCAVGHERDFTLAEMAADVRASTPTAAAQALVPDRQELRDRIGSHIRQMHNGIERSFEQRRGELRIAVSDLHRSSGGITGRLEMSIERLGMSASLLNQRIHAMRAAVADRATLLHSLDPRAILSRGYSILRKSGKIVTSTDSLTRGDRIKITLAHGEADATIDDLQHA